jgi:hypothetical protein
MLKLKPRLYYKSSGERCDKIQIEFTVDTKVLAYVAYHLLDNDPNEKITKKRVESKLRELLEWEGKNWLEKLEYEELNKERLTNAQVIIKKLYPHWHLNYNNNGQRFIMED